VDATKPRKQKGASAKRSLPFSTKAPLPDPMYSLFSQALFGIMYFRPFRFYTKVRNFATAFIESPEISHPISRIQSHVDHRHDVTSSMS
jgi:hypothetical protein